MKDPRVDDYIRSAQPFAQPVLRHLRTLVHRALPEVTEAIKWGMPCFVLRGTICHMAAFKAHAVFGFRNQSLMTASTALFKEGGLAMGSFGRLMSKDDLPADKAIISALKEAAALDAQGVKAKHLRTTEPKPATRIHPAFKRAIDANAEAKAQFAGFPPGKRRDYVEWIAEAKTDATREKRIAQAVEWIAEGKSRNWKYEKRK